jgi:hypothetical protein
MSRRYLLPGLVSTQESFTRIRRANLKSGLRWQDYGNQLSPLDQLRAASELWAEGTNIDGSSNATLTNGQLVGTLFNYGQYGNLTEATPSQQPTFQTNVRNGNDVLGFDGIADEFHFASTSDLEFVWATGVFEIVVAFRVDTSGQNRPLLGNTFTGSNRGFMLQAHATGTGRFFITTGAAVAAVVNTVGSVTPGAWTVLGARGDGTNVDISFDLSSYWSAARTQTYVAGAAVYAPGLFSDRPGSSGTSTDGALALVSVWDRELTADERALMRTHLNSVWGFSL